MPLEAKPHLPAVARTNTRRDSTNMVLNIDLDQRMTEAGNAELWPRFSSIERMCTPDYTIAFWIDINDETGRDWRTIFYKGGKKGERAPAMFIHPVTKRVQFHQTVQNGNKVDVMVVSSEEGIPLFTPTHVAVVRKDKTTTIYINGRASGSAFHESTNVCNEEQLHINPTLFGLKAFTGRLRNFRWYSVGLSQGDIKRLNFEGFENAKVSIQFRKRYSGSVEDGDVINHDDGLNSDDWTVAMWLKLTEGPMGLPLRVFQKGGDSNEHSPSLTVIPGTSKLSLRVNTVNYRSEGLLSPFELRLNQPTHVACVKAGTALRLYVNGILAKEVRLSGQVIKNQSPLYIARSSSSSLHNGFSGEMSSFRWFDRAFTGGDVSDLATSTAPPALASIEMDRSDSTVQAVTFPHSSKFNVREFSVEFWVRFLSGKFNSNADKQNKFSKNDANDMEAGSEDDDRVRSEEELLNDEFREQTPSAIDPDLAALTRKQKTEEDLALQVQKEGAGLANGGPGAGGKGRSADEHLRSAFDSSKLGRFEAFDREHQGLFDNDVVRSNADNGYEGFGDDTIQREPGGRWANSEVEKEETAEMIATLKTLKEAQLNQADSQSGADDEKDDGKDALDATNAGGFQGITGPKAQKASVIRQNEDRTTGYGDERTSEDNGRRSRDSQLRDGALDLSNAVPRKDEEGSHLNDDDMDAVQKPDEEGSHDGDIIDDNQLRVPGNRDPEDRDIDPYLYGGDPRTGAYKKPRKVASYTLLQEGSGASATAGGRRLLGTGDSRPEDAPVAADLPAQVSASEVTAASQESQNGQGAASRPASQLRRIGSGDPANPLTEEMSDKERMTPVLPPLRNFADADDKAKAKRADFEVSADGEEAQDELGRDEPALEEVTAGDDHAAFDNKKGGAAAGSNANDAKPRAEAADDSYAAESTTGTTDVPGRETTDEVSTEKSSDATTISDAEDQTPEETSRAEEAEEVAEDQPTGEEGGEPPSSSESSDRDNGKHYDEKFEEQEHPETPGHRPANSPRRVTEAPTKADIAQTASGRDDEGDFTGGDIPGVLALFRKGSRWSQFTPTLQLLTGNMKLRARVSTSAATNETLVSKGSLYVKQPNHVAMVVEGRLLSLYINGVLDSQTRLDGALKFNAGPLRVARELRAEGVAAQVSRFRFHQRALRETEMRQVKYSVAQPLRAYYNEMVGDHLYSTRPLMKGVAGYRYLGIKGWLQSEPVPGSIPLYRFYNQAVGDHRYAIDRLDDADASYAYTGIVGYVFPTFRKNTAALIEFHNPAVGDHFYTTDVNEAGDSFYAGYNKVGTICYVEVERSPARPMYRFYNRDERPATVLETNARVDLDGSKALKLLSSEIADSTPKAWSLAMWVELFDDATGEIRVLFRRGNNTEAQTPSAYLQPTNNKLEFQITTTSGVEKWFSNGDLPLRALTHIALTYDGKEVRFYVSGKLDSSYTPQGTITESKFPLRVGAGNADDGKGFRGRVRDVRWYDRAISDSTLERITSVTASRPALVFNYGPRFRAETSVAIENSQSFISSEWSIFFTVEPTGDCEEALCPIISKGSQLSVGINQAGQIEASIVGENKETVTVKSSDSLSIKVPASVALVFEAGQLYLYLDGVLSNKAALTDGQKQAFSDAPVTLGAEAGVKSFRGFLTAVEWHRRAFSQAEVVVRADHSFPPVLLQLEKKDRLNLNSSIVVPAGREFSTIGITVSLWIKLLQHTDFTTSILTRGLSLTEANPAITLRKDGKIQVLVETGNILQSCLSHSVIPLNIPTHIAVTRSGRTIKIFINGVEDAVHVSGFPFSDNSEKIVVGKFSDSLPAPLAWIRELQWHDIAMERPQVDKIMRLTR